MNTILNSHGNRPALLPSRSGAPAGVPPLLHHLLWPLRFGVILASTAAVTPIFLGSMLLHAVRVALSAIPGVLWLSRRLHGAYHGVLARLGRPWLSDERDTPIFAAIVSIALSGAAVFGTQLWLYQDTGAVHYGLVVLFYTVVFGPKTRGFVRFFSAWHQEIHRPGGILKGRSPFEAVFGFSFCAFLLAMPTGFIQSGVAHVQQHHRENGNFDDAFGSAQYNHANLWHFFCYMTRDVFYQIFLITPGIYFAQRGRRDLAWIQFKANALYMAVAAGVFVYSWQIGVFYVLIPWLATLFMVGLVNWTQHPFYGGREDSLNFLSNTLTVIEEPVNFLNEGYHLCHHYRSGAHWTRNPELFEELRPKMQAADSLVFRGLGVTEVFLLLTLLRAFRTLAKYLEPMSPQTAAMSLEERAEHIRQRSAAAPVFATIKPKQAG